MRISDWSSDVCSSDLHAKGVAPFRLDLAHRVLIFLQPLVDRVQQRLPILPGALFALLEARVGAFEKRLLRSVEHPLSDLATLRGDRRLRLLASCDLPLLARLARLLPGHHRPPLIAGRPSP